MSIIDVILIMPVCQLQTLTFAFGIILTGRTFIFCILFRATEEAQIMKAMSWILLPLNSSFEFSTDSVAA